MNDTVIHTFALPVDNPAKDFQAFSAFHGPTRTFADMECHASVLKGGQSPHLPHAHVEEELLIPLHGEVELRIATSPHDPAPRIERIAPGSFVYYPAGQHHTVRNPGSAAIGYLMFKWNAALTQNAQSPLSTAIHHFGDVAPPADARPFWTHRIFQGPTSLLGKLHAHLTVLQPGAGYEPHVDAYDVAIVLLSGTIETLGQTVAPFTVIYYAAGEPHGLRNVGTEPARYLVFEFHSPGVDALPPRIPLHRTLPARVVGFGKRLARPVWRRLRRKSSLW